ncbi:hypothetical protein [Wenzhouxiangella limi]|uniref:Uncharacterized protein n=1 Tax=Wenzhouxiangella limi TaxID=2707351 RepID=A0A845URG0_9GAMM|nr:hypothetical protein [Wenzhouxiangella limi]NDY94157.1 hypothetical protein [Wenzhouxiangella limi]
MAMKLTFYVLIFYLLFSIAAGLLIPGDVVGRYTLVTEQAASCSDLENRLESFNVNDVRYRVVPADITELADEVADGTACWLEIRGVPDSGVGDAAAPLYEAALRMTDGPLSIERAYQPRFGQAETVAIWLLSILLAVLIIFSRRPSKTDPEV